MGRPPVPVVHQPQRQPATKDREGIERPGHAPAGQQVADMDDIGLNPCGQRVPAGDG